MPRTKSYTSYARWHPRFVEAYSHLEALYEDKPVVLHPRTDAKLAEIRENMIEHGRLQESDRGKLRDILRRMGRKMPRAFVGRVFRGEKFYLRKEPEFRAAARDISNLYAQFINTSTPPLMKPEHASLLRDVWETMNGGKLFESQRQTLYRVFEKMGRKPSTE